MPLSIRRANSCKILQIISKSALILCIIATFCSISASAGRYEAYADGAAECVAELYTGQILHCKNQNVKLPMASTTKIMTALIVIEDCDLDEVITVADEAVGTEGSSIYLKKGEKISVKDLLYGLMLRSGNDSAVALAIYHSGSTQKFAECMNERAKKAGATSTNFKNPSGLPDTEHYTTASDLCKIACEAMKNPIFRKIVSAKSYTGEFRSYVNKNKILKMVEGANGIKTGYTLKAGRCLVSSAKRDGMDVVSVVLNCPDMYERSKKLIENAFNKYSVGKIDQNTIFMCGIVPCKIENTGNFLIEKDKKVNYNIEQFSDEEKAKNGGAQGKLSIYCGNDLIFSSKLYSIITK